MYFHKKPVASRSCGRTSEWRDEFPLTAGFCSASAGQLDAVGGVEDDRISEAAHDRKRAHIHDQIVVTER